MSWRLLKLKTPSLERLAKIDGLRVLNRIPDASFTGNFLLHYELRKFRAMQWVKQWLHLHTVRIPLSLCKSNKGLQNNDAVRTDLFNYFSHLCKHCL